MAEMGIVSVKVLTEDHEYAIRALALVMQKARDENPCGDLYRTIDTPRLIKMLDQNIAELKIAIEYDNDVTDKIADCANYLSFILHNYVALHNQQATNGPSSCDCAECVAERNRVI